MNGKWGSKELGTPSHYFLEGKNRSVCGYGERTEMHDTYDIPGITCRVCNEIFSLLRVVNWLKEPQRLKDFLRRNVVVGMRTDVVLVNIKKVVREL